MTPGNQRVQRGQGNIAVKRMSSLTLSPLGSGFPSRTVSGAHHGLFPNLSLPSPRAASSPTALLGGTDF